MLTDAEFQHNLNIYKKEASLAMSIADSIPGTQVDQDRRSKNRFREHSGPGHMLMDTGQVSNRQPNHTLHRCGAGCDWVGWLIPKKDEDDTKLG